MRPRPFLAAVSCLATIALAQPARAQRVGLPSSLIALDAPEGQRLLMQSDARADFFPLAERFVTQERPSYCGVASSVMVLDALGVTAPDPPAFGRFRGFTQTNVFTARAEHAVTADAVQHGGMTLDQLAGLLQAYPAHARAVHASDTTLDEFRRLAVANLRSPNDYVIVNYNRGGVGQEPSGHISPLGAYETSTDRFLLMDVARYKYPPVWVTAAALYDAMNTRDMTAGLSRGFVLVDAAAVATTPEGLRAADGAMRFVAKMVGAGFALGLLLGVLGAVLVGRLRRRARAV